MTQVDADLDYSINALWMEELLQVTYSLAWVAVARSLTAGRKQPQRAVLLGSPSQRREERILPDFAIISPVAMIVSGIIGWTSQEANIF
jgi:hypothetical protein